MISEIEERIRNYQKMIDELNQEVFKHPGNKAHPPSTYLEVYNDFTENLHNLQEEKQVLVQRQHEVAEKALRRATPSPVQTKLNHQQSSHRVNNSISSIEDTSNYLNQSGGSSSDRSSSYNINQSVSMTSIPCSSPLIPPLSSALNGYFEYEQAAAANGGNRSKVNSSYSISGVNIGSLPVFKVEHPTSLPTSENKNKNFSSSSNSKPSTPTLPIMYQHRDSSSSNNNGAVSISTSLTTSPATTPTLPYNHNIISISPPQNASPSGNNTISGVLGINQPYIHSVSLANSSLSLPLTNVLNVSLNVNNNGAANNGNNKLMLVNTKHHVNSSSFTDISDALSTPNGSINSNINNPNSISPSNSILGTLGMSSPFLRVYIGPSTAVVSFNFYQISYVAMLN